MRIFPITSLRSGFLSPLDYMLIADDSIRIVISDVLTLHAPMLIDVPDLGSAFRWIAKQHLQSFALLTRNNEIPFERLTFG